MEPKVTAQYGASVTSFPVRLDCFKETVASRTILSTNGSCFNTLNKIEKNWSADWLPRDVDPLPSYPMHRSPELHASMIRRLVFTFLPLVMIVENHRDEHGLEREQRLVQQDNDKVRNAELYYKQLNRERKTPRREVLIKRKRFVEHCVHRGDLGGVPCGDILIDER
jgi:hypothetical protein